MTPRVVLVAAYSLMLLPVMAGAQSATTGAIAGVVRDPSGAVLPGVTVEAASPALIEKVRVVVTDGQGLYRIGDLRPGTYRVTFTLPGFSPFVREGLELSTAFTATVNAELRVGGVAESVTVTGETPVVDTRNVMAREVYKQETVEALPVARNTGMWATLIPAAKGSGSGDGTAATSDVGGTQSERANPDFTVHGGTNDIRLTIDGMEFFRGAFSINSVSTQETNIQVGGIPAENETGGVRINIVPREGGNTFSGLFQLDGTNDDFQSDNVDDELRARGVRGTPSSKQAYNVGGGLGGPIVQDRLWFFTAHRKWSTQLRLPEKFWNATQGTPVFTPDSSRSANSDDFYRSHNVRLTWQASERHKFGFAYQYESNCNCVIRLIDQNRAPEATANHNYTQHFPQGTWMFPVTNRFMVEGAAGWHRATRTNDRVEGVTEDAIAIRELSTNFRYNSRGDAPSTTGGYGASDIGHVITERVAVSYVTGTHNFKTGLFMQQWPGSELFEINQGVRYEFRNGVPNRVVQFASPQGRKDRAYNYGLYAQDQWTIDRLTLNLGARIDYWRAYAREQTLPAGPFVPERHFDETDDLINFKDINPRMGGAYDLFGDGRTALKGFLGRYVVGRGASTGSRNPAARIVTEATRTWNDANGDFIPQEQELGPLSNAAFGSARRFTVTQDRELSFGWGNRDYTWQGTVSIEHELRPGLAVNVGYFRTWYGNLQFVDNRAVTAGDFNEYCITAPVDPRLGGGVSGSEICGLYDVTPGKFGQVDNLEALAGDRRSQTFNGVDMALRARFAQSGVLNAGLAMGETVLDDCDTAVDSPGDLRFCKTTLGWGEDVQFKLNASYPLPWWGVQTAVNIQSLPGFPIQAVYVATNAEIAPSLGRNLSAGARSTVEIPLLEPNTEFEDRRTLVDLRLTKLFNFAGVRLAANADIYNLFNNNALQSLVTQFGPRWLNGINVVSGRLARFGVQVQF